MVSTLYHSRLNLGLTRLSKQPPSRRKKVHRRQEWRRACDRAPRQIRRRWSLRIFQFPRSEDRICRRGGLAHRPRNSSGCWLPVLRLVACHQVRPWPPSSSANEVLTAGDFQHRHRVPLATFRRAIRPLAVRQCELRIPSQSRDEVRNPSSNARFDEGYGRCASEWTDDKMVEGGKAQTGE